MVARMRKATLQGWCYQVSNLLYASFRKKGEARFLQSKAFAFLICTYFCPILEWLVFVRGVFAFNQSCKVMQKMPIDSSFPIKNISTKGERIYIKSNGKPLLHRSLQLRAIPVRMLHHSIWNLPSFDLNRRKTIREEDWRGERERRIGEEKWKGGLRKRNGGRVGKENGGEDWGAVRGKVEVGVSTEKNKHSYLLCLIKNSFVELCKVTLTCCQ